VIALLYIVPGTDSSLTEAGKSATIVGFGTINVTTGAKTDILQKAEVKVSVESDILSFAEVRVCFRRMWSRSVLS
jgi:hypothetical protein